MYGRHYQVKPKCTIEKFHLWLLEIWWELLLMVYEDQCSSKGVNHQMFCMQLDSSASLLLSFSIVGIINNPSFSQSQR